MGFLNHEGHEGEEEHEMLGPDTRTLLVRLLQVGRIQISCFSRGFASFVVQN